MLPDKIMQSDVLDILFENRNKTYGAYALRKSYNKRMAHAITITLFIAIVFSFFQFMYHVKEKMQTIQIVIPPDYVFDKIDPVKPQSKTPVIPHAAPHFKEVISTPPVIVSNEVKTDMPTVDEKDKSIIGDKKIWGDDATGEVQPYSNSGQGLATIETKTVEPKADDSPLNWAQVMPEYPGGIEALKKFMIRNLSQPENIQPGEKIIVMASFIVSKTGQIEQVKIVNTGRPDLNKEVQRVIHKMPVWKPGLQNGNTVAVYFNLPVTFMNAEEN